MRVIVTIGNTQHHELKRIALIYVDYVNGAVQPRIKAVRNIVRTFSVEI